MRIIVDAMGGDYAPKVVVKGVIDAVKEYAVDVVLVGNEKELRDLLQKEKYRGNNIQIYPAEEVIGMSESGALSIRRKRNSSIVVGLNLLKDGKGDAFFSAGHTGAVVSGATLTLGLLPEIERPGISIIIPSLKNVSMIIDVGANIDPKPSHLLKYAIMADAYFRHILSVANPTVGLLNIGEEETKGTDFHKEVFELLSKSSLNFKGNLEARDLFSGKCDVIVCDGFVGNIALKVSESVAEAIQGMLKTYLKDDLLAKFGILLLMTSLMRLKKKLDYSEYGGVPLLGVNGIVIIGHGRSNPKAIKNAVRVAKKEVENQFNEKLLEALRNKVH